jgi:hypothetical protein
MGHLLRLLVEVELISSLRVRNLFLLRKRVILTEESRNLNEPIVLV